MNPPYSSQTTSADVFQIFKSYAEISLLEILRKEHKSKSIPGLFFSGISTVALYHVSDYAGFLVQTFIDGIWDEDDKLSSSNQLLVKHAAQTLYVLLSLDLAAIQI